MATNNATNNGTIANGKDGRSIAWSIRDEDLQELEDLKRDLLDKADKAREAGSLFMMTQYTRLVGLVTPEIKRIRDRFDRETLAGIRKEEKALKLQARNEKQAAKEAAGEA